MSELSMYMPWIRDAGAVTLQESREITEAFLKEHSDCRYISFHVNRFSAGFADTTAKELEDTLLELRLFNACAELRLFRTALNSNLQYRIADDQTLEANLALLETEDSFLKDPEHYRHPTYQVLDIDTAAPEYKKKETDAHDCRRLRTVGGGSYVLPLSGDEDTAVVMDYLSYDPVTGVCRAVDERIVGFEKWEGGEADG